VVDFVGRGAAYQVRRRTVFFSPCAEGAKSMRGSAPSRLYVGTARIFIPTVNLIHVALL
jgi:hypothetical protein